MVPGIGAWRGVSVINCVTVD